MKQTPYRIIRSILIAVVAIGICVYNTVQRNSIDYQAHPFASLLGSAIPGIIVGFAFYWWDDWRAKSKQKATVNITPEEAASLIASNFNDQYADDIKVFLCNASAKDIQAFIHSVNAQSGYIDRARTSLVIRLAEDAEIISRRVVHLTWALLVVSIALLAFAVWQTIIIKNDADKHSNSFQVGQNHAAMKSIAGDEPQNQKPPATSSEQLPHQTDNYLLAGIPPMNGQSFLTEANQGDVIAQYCLGLSYYNGSGIQQDYIKAAIWLRRAADQGYADAQSKLGDCYADGIGVVKDQVEALKWYSLASQQGATRSDPRRDALISSLSRNQISEASRLYNEFQPHKESTSASGNTK